MRALAHRFDGPPPPWVSILVVSVFGVVDVALLLFFAYALGSPSGLEPPPPVAGASAVSGIRIMADRVDRLGGTRAFDLFRLGNAHRELTWVGQREPSTGAGVVSVGSDEAAIAVAVRGPQGCLFERRTAGGVDSGTFAPPCTAERALSAP
jgi:hypothetical protein